tara:strand:- start:88 stop:648 length:561 start_codon:yes stop_codon:yes gene_type:complete
MTDKEPERYYEWMLWKLRQEKGEDMAKWAKIPDDVDWVKNINDMHKKFGVHDWLNNKIKEEDYYTLKEFLEFRMRFLDEELNETKEAIKHKHADDIVDGLIDLCVIAIGTLDILGVDAHRAWRRVHRANMAKEVGQKESRPNDLGLPDMVKPDDWIGPDHKDNIGYTKLFLKNKNDVDIWRKDLHL